MKWSQTCCMFKYSIQIFLQRLYKIIVIDRDIKCGCCRLISAQRVAEGVLNLGIQVNQDSPSTELVISGILPRTDKPNLMLKVNEANKIVKSFCLENNWAFIDHKSFNSTCLNTRGLHLNRKGTSIIASNISNYINAD